MPVDNISKPAGAPFRRKHGQDQVQSSKERDAVDKAMLMNIHPILLEGLEQGRLKIEHTFGRRIRVVLVA